MSLLPTDNNKEKPNWLNCYLRQMHPINIDLFDVEFRPIISFPLIWGIFEKVSTTLFPNANSEVELIENTTERFAIPSTVLDEVFDFFKGRYVDDNTVNYHFGLYLWPEKRSPLIRNKVIDALCKSNIPTETKNYVCGMICLRIRNNLFHGMKDVATLRNQISLFEHASYYMTNLIEVIIGRKIEI